MSDATLIQAALILPVGAAVFALLVEDGAGGRLIPMLLMVAAAASAAAAGVFAAVGNEVVWQRFETDAWRGVLSAGALAGSAAAMIRGGAGTRAALAIGGSAAAASIVSPDVLYLGVTLAVSSAAFAVASFAASHVSPLRRSRMLLPLIAADALAIGGLAIAARATLAFEPVSGAAGGLLLAGAALRLGLIPAIVDDAVRAEAGAIWLGPVRAQGALLAGLAVAGSSSRGFWLLALGAAGAAIASVRLSRDSDAAAVLVVPAAIAAAGIGLGGPVAIAGAALALAASFAALVMLQSSASLAVPTLSFAPAGGALLGFGLAGGALWRVAAARPEFVPAAVALGVAAGLAAVTAWEAAERGRATPSVARHAPAAFVAASVAVPALVVAGALAFAPGFAFERAGTAIALAAGAAPALVVPPESLSEGLGIAVAGLVLAGLLAGGLRRGTSATHRVDPPPRWMRGWAAALPAPREHSLDAMARAGRLARPWLIASAVATAAVAAGLARLVLTAGGRGWL